MKSQFSNDGMNDVKQSQRQAKYMTPKLIEYGALRDITLSRNLATGKNDNSGNSASNKTV